MLTWGEGGCQLHDYTCRGLKKGDILKVSDTGEVDVKSVEKSADVLYGRPLTERWPTMDINSWTVSLPLC